MPEGKFVCFGVLVGNKKMPEYRIKDEIFTEVDLHGPHSYFIEEDGQKYPVLPFQISLRKISKEPLWISVYLDGQVITTRPFCGQSLNCNGIKVGNEIHELLFTLPRIKEDQTTANELGEHAGTITVVCTAAIITGEKKLPIFICTAAKSQCNQNTVFHQLTKKDVSLSKNGGIVGREGQPTLQLTQSKKFRRVNGYAPSREVLEVLVLNYRPCIYSYTPEVPKVKSDSCSSETKILPELNAETKFNGKMLEDPKIIQKDIDRQETISLESLKIPEIKQRDSCCLGPTDFSQQDYKCDLNSPMKIKRRASEMFEAIRIKQEDQDSSIIIIDENDDEVYDYSYEGDSVIYMGDDDCCILDISQNISLIELEETLLMG